MKKIIVGLFALVFVVQSFGEFKPFKVVASRDGVVVAVDPLMIVQKLKAIRAEAQQKTSYVEYLAFPKQGYNVYADAGDGQMDTVPVVIIESNKTDVGIFQAVGNNIYNHPWAWGSGAVSAIGGVVAIGIHNGWFGGKDDDNGGGSTSQSADDHSDRSDASTHDGPVTEVNGDGNTVTINITQPAAAP